MWGDLVEAKAAQKEGQSTAKRAMTKIENDEQEEKNAQ